MKDKLFGQIAQYVLNERDSQSQYKDYMQDIEPIKMPNRSHGQKCRDTRAANKLLKMSGINEEFLGCINQELVCKARDSQSQYLPYNKQEIINWVLPIDTVSESNISEHWSKRGKRHRTQRQIIWIQWRNNEERFQNVKTPCIIRITRISPRQLDDDNLRGACKSTRDGIADCIVPGRAPGRSDNVEGMTFEYHQEKGKPKEKAIRIQIFC